MKSIYLGIESMAAELKYTIIKKCFNREPFSRHEKNISKLGHMLEKSYKINKINEMHQPF